MNNLHFREFPLAHVRLRFAHELQKPYPHLSALCLCKMGDPPRIFSGLYIFSPPPRRRARGMNDARCAYSTPAYHGIKRGDKNMQFYSSDYKSWLEIIWNALHGYREDCIPEHDPMHDKQWNDITYAMDYIEESLKPEESEDLVDINEVEKVLNLIEVDKDGDGFICKEAMEEVRKLIVKLSKS